MPNRFPPLEPQRLINRPSRGVARAQVPSLPYGEWLLFLAMIFMLALA